MRGFGSLLRVSFQNLILNTFQFGNRNKKKAATGILAVGFIAAFMLYISAFFSYAMADALEPMGALDLLIGIMGIGSLAFPLFFTMFTAQGTVFGTKDMDLVFSLPVSALSIMLARVLALYLEILIMVEFLLLPAGVVYLLFGGAGGALFLVKLFAAGLFWTLIPTTIGLLFGCIISVLVARLERKNLFSSLFSVLLFVGFMAVYVWFMGNFESMLAGLVQSRGDLYSAFPPLAWLIRSTAGGEWLPLLLLAVVSVAAFLLVSWLFSLRYKPLLSRLASHSLRKNYKLGQMKASGRMGALLKKEVGRFFGTPAYLLNCGVSLLMMVAISVWAAVSRDGINGVLAELAAENLVLTGDHLMLVIMAAEAFLVAMCYTSAASISLEGKYLWILKESPLGTGRIFATKAGFNLLLTGSTLLVCVPLAGFAFSLVWYQILLAFGVGLLFAVWAALSGLMLNLLFPAIDAPSDAAIVKRSTSVMLAMFGNWIVAGLLAVLFIPLSALGFGIYGYVLVAVVLLVAMNAAMLALLNTKGRRLFKAL